MPRPADSPAADPAEVALAAACQERGLDPAGAALLSHSSNAVYHLPRVAAVARITTGPGACERVARTQSVTRWLVDQGFAATEPLRGTPMVDLDDHTCVSFWVYYPQDLRRQEQPDSSHMGRLLRELHQTEPPHIELPAWTPLESLAATVGDPDRSQAITPADRSWLSDRVAQVREQLLSVDWPLGTGLIHGDAWAGNLLWDTTSDAVVLGDWDWVSTGPREVDLIPTWHATIRYGRPPSWPQRFTEEYGFDLATWPGYDVMLQMRDLVQLTGPLRRAPHSPAALAALHQRLGDLRRGDRHSTWAANQHSRS